MYNNDVRKVDEATLRLFKSIMIIEGSNYSADVDSIVNLTKKGIILEPNIKFLDPGVIKPTIDTIINMYGKDVAKMSNTFHKDWRTVETISPELHYLQQVLHYITTYGYDSLGIDYDESNAYIPNEKVMVPENVTPFNFMIIRALTVKDLAKRIQSLLSSGVALSQQQIEDVIFLVNMCELPVDFNEIKNKEIKTILWLGLEDKPYINVDELLRALSYIVLSQSLVLRSYRQYQTIKTQLKFNEDKQVKVASILEEYTNKFGIENISSQFLRNKMLFLAFKCDKTKVLINKIRRQADKYHKPQQEDDLSLDDIKNANIWQLFKYYNLCISNLNPTKDKLYQIRNGLNYLKENNNFNISGKAKSLVVDHYTQLLNVIRFRIAEELSFLKDKILLVPDYIDYKIPTSLKRLIEGVPEGSVITLPSHFVLGVHWSNIPAQEGSKYNDWDDVYENECRVDLDLHANSINNSISWCSNFRNDEVLYSGDMTDAPIERGGASEALLFKTTEPTYLITLCDFTQYKEVPYKFIFDFDSKEIPCFQRGFNNGNVYGNIFSPNARTLNSKITDHGQNTLGLVSNGKFYFTNGSIFKGPITYKTDLLERLLSYYEESQTNSLTIKQLSDIVGFRVIANKEDLKDEFEEIPEILDLSLEAITQDTFVTLFSKPEEGDIVE